MRKYIKSILSAIIVIFFCSLWVYPVQATEDNECSIISYNALIDIHNDADVLISLKHLYKITKFVDKMVLSSNSEEEDKLSEEKFYQSEAMSRDINENEQRRFWGSVFGIVLVFIYIILGLILYLRFGRDPNTSFRDKYYDKPPNKYLPALVSILLHNKKVRVQDIMATIIYLAAENKLFIYEDNNDIVVKIGENIVHTDLSEPDSYFINWLIEKIGSGSSVTLTAIKEYSMDKYTRQEFRKNFIYWQSLLADKANNLFDISVKNGKMMGTVFAFFFIILGALITITTGVTWTSYLLFPGIIFLLSTLKLKRRTPEGAKQFKMWLAYKRYLNDNIIDGNENQNSLVIEEECLAYAVSFGLNKKLIKKIWNVTNNNIAKGTNISYANLLESLTEAIEVMDKSVS